MSNSDGDSGTFTQRDKIICLLSLILLAFQLITSSARSQVLAESQARDFLRALCRSDSSLIEFIDQHEFRHSERLGIKYDGVFLKCLIASELDSTARSGVLTDSPHYSVNVSALDNSYQKLTVSRGDLLNSHEYYFKNGKFVQTSSYQIRNWRQLESTHFRFFFSDSSLINTYCVTQLEQFFTETAALLGYTTRQIELIGREKFEYVLCRSPLEVATLTGYESRGMYELSSDRIISCYGAHYHELVHLMVNFKLKHLPLWTHPFLQEGIAVALGGRGGIERRVILEMAGYLVESELASVDELLAVVGFNQSHSSINYPVSGLYCDFLLEQVGIEKFLETYRRYTATGELVGSMALSKSELPSDSLWLAFVKGRNSEHLIDLDPTDSSFVDIYRDSLLAIAEGPSQYLIKTRSKVKIGADESLANFRSGVFDEQFEGEKYSGEKYAIIANAEEIKIYSLYTGNLIANFVGAFRIPAVTIATDGQYYRFAVDKIVFDGNLKQDLAGDKKGSVE